VRITGSFLILVMVILPIVQAQVLPITLKDMVEHASTIVTGRVIEVREGSHPKYPNVNVTFIKVEVEEMLKGQPNHRSQHVFMQFGGLGATRLHELPTYDVGQEVTLFLYPESQYGFTSPVGGEQGKFSLRADPQTGQKVVTYGLGSTKLFEGIGVEKFSSAERQVLQGRSRASDYHVFASIVRKLVKD
jgi:hypothetical protein